MIPSGDLWVKIRHAYTLLLHPFWMLGLNLHLSTARSRPVFAVGAEDLQQMNINIYVYHISIETLFMVQKGEIDDTCFHNETFYL